VLPADTTAGVMWLFRYRAASASASKWEFVGGSPLTSYVAATDVIALAAYGDGGTVGPSVTAPRAGDYLILFGLGWFGDTGTSIMSASPKLGAAAAQGADAVDQISSSVGNYMGAPTKQLPKTLAAADVVKLQYQRTAGNMSVFRRFLSLTPVRVT
jgi:hypothetical protein